ncbi:uncharacterized protein LOC110448575 [Mizuhopecten yessoensis]|uniref:uncharacterized protein LOC110448575 n=1 Tax=Mizuhopecten yessoensis TaxID=6573 RepID=UPI000B45C398|nr:uncharacterized protein LOC110448575 [Mizuhopecten yessoensis]
MGGASVEADSSATKENGGFLQNINDCLGLQKKMAAVQQYVSDHPIISLFLMVTIVMCSVPFFCFFAFVFAASIFGFTGFVIFEGVVLLFASLVLFWAVVLMGLLSIGLSTSVVLGYFTFRFSWSMVNNVSTSIPLPECLASRLPDWATIHKECK